MASSPAELALPLGHRRGTISTALFALTISAAATGSVHAGGTLTVGMTAGDIPVTTGNPDQGFEGYRFVGYNLYDGLLLWDLSKSDKPSEPKPGLATSYEIDPNNQKRWIVHLRQGVTWHDGCSFTADDVIWNFQMRMDQNAPNFSAQQFTYTRAFLSNVKAVTKVDDYTVAIENNFVELLFPYTLTYVLMISPCRAKEVNYDWAQYALHPSGTGPYKFDRVVPHQRLELVPNAAYWDKARIPKQDRLVLIPMPEASTRTAALLTGQVNWIEAPSPDAIPRLKSSGMKIVTNVYPHDWPYLLNYVRGPFKDLRVRQAANYAINRQDVVDLLGGTAMPEHDVVPPSMAYYGHPAKFEYDPKKAKALLAEAGCLPCKVTFGISTSGSGQMQPLPMNELVKSQLEEAGLRGHPTDYGLECAARRLSRRGRQIPRTTTGSISRAACSIRSTRSSSSSARPIGHPPGPNWGHFESPETEALIEQIFNEFDEEKRLGATDRTARARRPSGGDDLCRARPQSARDVAQSSRGSCRPRAGFRI